ncbi:hypothetical protein PMAYCL1PPCAC_15743, partial [Pristionchus mayeri]
RSVLLVSLLILVPNLPILTSFTYAVDDPEDVRRALAMARPDYDLDHYALEECSVSSLTRSRHHSILRATVQIVSLKARTYLFPKFKNEIQKKFKNDFSG